MFQIHGVKFANRTAAAVEMVNAGMSVADAARDSGLTYQTVYVNTVAVEKTAMRMNKYRAIHLAKSSRHHSLSAIADLCGIKRTTLRDMLKRENVR